MQLLHEDREDGVGTQGSNQSGQITNPEQDSNARESATPNLGQGGGGGAGDNEGVGSGGQRENDKKSGQERSGS